MSGDYCFIANSENVDSVVALLSGLKLVVAAYYHNMLMILDY